jgi:hypothetical protein
MFCAPELIFGGTDGIRSRYHVLRTLTRFRRCGGRRVPFSCFALLDTFSVVPRASGPVFMSCAPGLIFGDPEGFASRLHVLRARTHIWRYRRRPLLFSCFALTHTFSAVRRASDYVFMFCAPAHVFGVAEGVASRFHILRSLTHF